MDSVFLSSETPLGFASVFEARSARISVGPFLICLKGPLLGSIKVGLIHLSSAFSSILSISSHLLVILVPYIGSEGIVVLLALVLRHLLSC